MFGAKNSRMRILSTRRAHRKPVRPRAGEPARDGLPVRPAGVYCEEAFGEAGCQTMSPRTFHAEIWLPRQLEWLFVRRDLERIFQFRRERLRALFSKPV